MSPTLRKLLIAGSIILAGSAFWLWLQEFSVTETSVRELLGQLNWWTVPVIFFLLCTHVSCSAKRWARLETALGGQAPDQKRALITSGLALGLGTVLPGPVASIACRSASNRIMGGNAIRGAVGGGLDQFADFAMVCFFVPAALVAIYWNSLAVYGFSCCVLAVIGWLLITRRRPGHPGVFANWLVHKWPRSEALFTPGLASAMYRYSLVRFVCLSLITLMVHYASGAASATGALVAVPLVTVAISIAMLPGAFGVSEWSFSGVLALLATPQGEIAVFVLANRLILTGLALVIAGLAIGWALVLSRAAAME